MEAPSTLEEVFGADGPCLKLLAHVEGGHVDELVQAAAELDLDGVHLWESGSRDQIELGPVGVDKGTSLSAWCRHRGIDAEHVVAFGDAPADVPMLAWAGRSYAVANAHPAAVAAASHRCAANTDDGVAAGIEALVYDAAALRH